MSTTILQTHISTIILQAQISTTILQTHINTTILQTHISTTILQTCIKTTILQTHKHDYTTNTDKHDYITNNRLMPDMAAPLHRHTPREESSEQLHRLCPLAFDCDFVALAVVTWPLITKLVLWQLCGGSTVALVLIPD